MLESQPPSGNPPSSDELHKALKAFKKRLKLMRLEDESKLGRGPLSGGRPSGLVAITPPHQYPRAVWDDLVNQGKLKYAGQGMYELANQ